jgi:hypothetical protein
MALPSSGPLTFADIQTEFGGSNPIGLNEYYAGGANVPAGTSGTYGAVPSSGQISVQNFYGTSDFIPIYPQNVYAAVLYTGNGSSQTITNNIDVAANGGLMWMKPRNAGIDGRHMLSDTARGVGYRLKTDTTGAEDGPFSAAQFVGSLTSTGYNVGSFASVNGNGDSFVSWTFRKQPKFFDIVIYTGTGSNNAIPHNLGSAPGCVIVKATDVNGDWGVWHRNTGNANESVLGISINTNNGAASTSGSQSYATSTTFDYQAIYDYTGSTALNVLGRRYVAYLFAHNAGGFGPTGTDNAISCGSFVSSISGLSVNLGYQPQYLMVKITAPVGLGWYIVDSQRGFTLGSSSSQALQANTAGAEGSLGWFTPTSTGFDVNAGQLSSGYNYIYIAIRKPM